MDKREKKIDVINRYLKNCTIWSYATYGNIQEEKFDNACRAYAGNMEYGDAIGMIDTTFFGSGKKGIIFTEKGVHYSTGQGGKYFTYAKALEFTGWSEYNCKNLNDMITRLKNIEIYDSEVAPSGWKLVGELIQGTANFISALSEAASEETKNNNDIKMLEANTNNYIQAEYTDVKEKNDENDEEIIEMLETVKSHLKDTITMLGNYIDICIESEQEKNDYLYKIVLLAAIYSGDKELAESNMFSEKDKEEISSQYNSAKELIEVVDSTLDSINNAITQKVSFSKAIKLYAHRIKTAVEDFSEDNDIDAMYQNTQISLKDLKNSIRKMIKNINTVIEQLYSE